MFTQLTNRKIGTIVFDAVTSENHQSDLQISENPVESGALVADHAVVKPKEITITGVMVEHDHATTPLYSLNVPHIRGVADFLNKIPLPIKLNTYTTQTLAKANRVISQFNAIKSQLSNALDFARPIAPWLPDFGNSSGRVGGNRVQQCYAELVATQKSGETIEIQTGIQLYQNMLITAISVTQTQDGSAEFSITAREILIVQTATVATNGNNKGAVTTQNKVSGQEKSGRAKTQSAGKSQKGKVNLSPRTPPSLDFGNASKGGGSGNSNGKRTSVLAKIFN